MKKIIAILLIMVMLVMLVVGCVSRQDYDALMVEYDGMRTRVESLQNDLVAAQGEVQTLQSDLAAEQSKSAKLESDLSAEQSKAAKLETDLAAEQSKTKELESDLAAEQSKTKTLEGDLSAAQSKVKSLEADNTILKGKMDKAEPYAELLENFYFVEYQEMTTSELMMLTAMVENLGDPEVKENFEAWMEATTASKAAERSVEFWIAVWDGFYEILYPGGAGA